MEKQKWEKLIRPLVFEGERILQSNIRRRMGFYDTAIDNWVDKCWTTLSQLGFARETFIETINLARDYKHTSALQDLVNLLRSLEFDSEDDILGREFDSLIKVPVPDFEKVRVRERTCFVMMPFSSDYYSVYESAIASALRKSQCISIRGDEIQLPGQITVQIFHDIASSNFCIADVSGKNPNVMYELGIAHTLKKPVIIIAQTFSNDVPFDVRHYRYISYERTDTGLMKLESAITRAISSILSSS